MATEIWAKQSIKFTWSIYHKTIALLMNEMYATLSSEKQLFFNKVFDS